MLNMDMSPNTLDTTRLLNTTDSTLNILNVILISFHITLNTFDIILSVPILLPLPTLIQPIQGNQSFRQSRMTMMIGRVDLIMVHGT